MFSFKKKKKKIKVYFICQYIQGCNKIYDVIMAMKNDLRFEVKALAVPDNIKDFPNNNDYNFWFSKFGDITINAVDGNKWFDLKNEKPDYIFIQRPYDNYLPDVYQINCLKKYSKICYIPYAFEIMDLRSVTMPDFFVKKVSMMFCSQTEEYNYCKKIINSADDNFKRKCFDLGYPSLFNIVMKKNKYNSAFNNIDKKNSFNVIWTPRWTMDDKLCKSSFFDYKDLIINYLKDREKINFVFRPHPLTFKNFVAEKIMTQKQVDNYLSNFKNSNMCYDYSSDYYDTFNESDVLVTDYSSIIIEYLLLDKPIIYCSKKGKVNSFLNKVLKCCYCVNNWSELKKTLELIQSGNDYLKKERNKFLNVFLKKYEEDVSLKILDEIEKDYYE